MSFKDEELDRLMEEAESKTKEEQEPTDSSTPEEVLPEDTKTEIVEIQQSIVPKEDENSGVGNAVNAIKEKIILQAVDKIDNKKIIEKHSDELAKISDETLKNETERERLRVEEAKADNKVIKQQIKNKLIELKSQAKMIKRTQAQLEKEQKEEFKAKNDKAKYDRYKGKLQKMKYDYLPNPFILSMLLFFDGVKSFFEGLGAVSTAIVKALKWVIIFAVITAVMLSIPLTREWLLTLLKFK